MADDSLGVESDVVVVEIAVVGDGNLKGFVVAELEGTAGKYPIDIGAADLLYV